MRLVLVLISLATLGLVFPIDVSAHCPLCVAGAGAGLTLSRLLGIDDSITGLWLAALIGAVSFWSERSIYKILGVKLPSLRNLLRPVIYAVFFGLTIASFYQFNLVNRMSQVMGLDKLTYGMVVGGILFYAVDVIDDLIIRAHKGVYFPYQRVIVSLGSIVLASIGQYVLINYYI